MTLVLSAIIGILLLYIIYVRRKAGREISEFSDSLMYNDFSRKFPRFQSVTDAFLKLAGEKEAQQHYLKKMLELVDTGILAYDMETLETLWMNLLPRCSTSLTSRTSIGCKNRTKRFSMNCSKSRFIKVRF